MLNKLPLIFIFTFLSFPSKAITYYCPKLPDEITVGETIEKNWFIWPIDERTTTLKIYYYKMFKKSYHFKYWASFPHGKNKGKFKGYPYYIGCCGWLQEEQRLICALRDTKKKECEEKIIGEKRKKFVCQDNHNLNNEKS
tara:strand:- start:1058 stop:1477 length:420 start_codon:yes stop_codon:yes gene_type:complete